MFQEATPREVVNNLNFFKRSDIIIMIKPANFDTIWARVSAGSPGTCNVHAAQSFSQSCRNEGTRDPQIRLIEQKGNEEKGRGMGVLWRNVAA